jgi:CHAT domain-containing protein
MSLARIARTCTLILLCGLLCGRDAVYLSKTRAELVLRELSAVQHFAGGRFTGMPHPGVRLEQSGPIAHLDGILPDVNAKSESERRMLSLVYALSGHLDSAEDVLRQLALESPNDSGIQNDLGVVSMGMAASDPTAWVTAIRQFESALVLRPNFPEAKFNLILSYRHLGLRKLESVAIEEYRKLEPESKWQHAVDQTQKSDDEVSSLAKRLETAGPKEIAAIVKRYPAQARELVLDFAFRPVVPVPANYVCIAQELNDQYGDATAKAAIDVLSTDDFGRIARARELAAAGRKLYLQGRFEETAKIYAEAQAVADKSGSLFDQLWIEINTADLREQQLDRVHAANLYRHAIEIARLHHLQWLLARTLSSLGSAPVLSGGIVNTISRLNEGVEIYAAIGETKELARPFYYLAAYHYVAASFEESLKYCLLALSAADPSDHYRLSGLHSMISEVLSHLGQSEIAMKFNEQAVEHAEQLGSPRHISFAKAQLASMYLTSNRTQEAVEQLEEAERALPQMSAGDRDLAEGPINLVRGRMAMLSGNFLDAESDARKNIEFFAEHPAVTGIRGYPQSRLLLARALTALGRQADAARELREAVSLVEVEQDHFPQNEMQITFDQDRREVYESAIDFEYTSTGCEESWNLTQGYKAKLFLNLLHGFGPAPDHLSTQRLTLSQVQQRIPNEVQVVEYIVLGDRLLTWVISRDKFQCRSTSVRATQLRDKINAFLSQITQRQPTESSAQDLYEILVRPINEFLNPQRTVVIIPDRDLHRLPFSALQSRDGHFWIEHTPIFQSPSITYLFSGQSVRSPNNRDVAFGSRLYNAITNAELNTLREIEPAIQMKMGSAVTRESFLKALGDHSLVYYAGHSAFDMRNTLQSAILLDGGRMGPNAVSALDITKQRTARNAVIILSSCETSAGNAIDGPGIRGLTSAFLISGAGSVVGSIWPVESTGTMQLMSAMFKFLVHDRRPIVNSLQAAQIELINNPTYRHPYYWSGFLVTGNLSSAN